MEVEYKTMEVATHQAANIYEHTPDSCEYQMWHSLWRRFIEPIMRANEGAAPVIFNISPTVKKPNHGDPRLEVGGVYVKRLQIRAAIIPPQLQQELDALAAQLAADMEDASKW